MTAFRSPDLTQIDFGLMGYIKYNEYCKDILNLNDLKDCITLQTWNITPDALHSAAEHVEHRLNFVPVLNGHMERELDWHHHKQAQSHFRKIFFNELRISSVLSILFIFYCTWYIQNRHLQVIIITFWLLLFHASASFLSQLTRGTGYGAKKYHVIKVVHRLFFAHH